MTDPAFRRMTEEEYLPFLADSPVRDEYVDGFVYAQSGATNAHKLIAMNVRERHALTVGPATRQQARALLSRCDGQLREPVKRCPEPDPTMLDRGSLMVDSQSRSAALYRRMGQEWAYEIVDDVVELPCPEMTL